MTLTVVVGSVVQVMGKSIITTDIMMGCITEGETFTKASVMLELQSRGIYTSEKTVNNHVNRLEKIGLLKEHKVVDGAMHYVCTSSDTITVKKNTTRRYNGSKLSRVMFRLMHEPLVHG